MTPSPGIARVTRLAPAASSYVPLAPPSAAALAVAVQGALALDLEPGCDPPPVAPALRVVAGERSGAEAWAARFAQVLLEVVAGDRSPHQLVRCLSEQVHEDLVRRVALLNRAAPPDQRRRRLRAQVRSVHVFAPTPVSAEVSLHVRHGQRSRAIAARVERQDGRWVCTALEFG